MPFFENKHHLLFLIISCCWLSCQKAPPPCVPASPYQISANKFKGMTVLATQSPINGTPLNDLQQLGVNSVAVTPYAFYTTGQATLDTLSTCTDPHCVMNNNTKAANIELITQAKQEGMRVLLKPHLWANNQWVNHLDFDTSVQWDSFEQNYTDYIIEWATIAQLHKVDLFCIGTEMGTVVRERPDFWPKLIDTIRQVYYGDLTYATNWDDAQAVTFWTHLDYIGIDAYFPLCLSKTPTLCELQAAWDYYSPSIKGLHTKWQKPVLFTEFGYMSVNQAAMQTWLLEAQKDQYAVNEEAQAKALQALLHQFGQEYWWAGGFQWKWYADSESAACDGDLSKEYTPENKKAADVLIAYYK